MLKVPWAEPIEAALRPFEAIVTIGLIAVAIISLWVAWKGNATGKTALFVWLVTP